MCSPINANAVPIGVDSANRPLVQGWVAIAVSPVACDRKTGWVPLLIPSQVTGLTRTVTCCPKNRSTWTMSECQLGLSYKSTTYTPLSTATCRMSTISQSRHAQTVHTADGGKSGLSTRGPEAAALPGQDKSVWHRTCVMEIRTEVLLLVQQGRFPGNVRT